MRVKHDRCTDCHADAHAGQLAKRADGGRCESCHDVNGFRPARFGPEDHAKTAYPLAGAHLAVACDQCHKPVACRHEPGVGAAPLRVHALRRLPQGPAPGRARRASSRRAAARPATASTPGARSPSTTRQTKYPLVGGHARVACAPCHRRTRAAGRPAELRFAGVPPGLRGCHRDPHQGQFARRRRRLLRALPHDRQPEGLEVRPRPRRRVPPRRGPRPARLRGVPPAGDPRTARRSSATSRSPRRAAAATARAGRPPTENADETPDARRRRSSPWCSCPCCVLHGQSTSEQPHGDLQHRLRRVPQPRERGSPVDKPPTLPPRHDRLRAASPPTRRSRAASCHRTLVFNQVGTACADCHKDAHRGELGFAAARRATRPTTWTNQREMFQAHNRTRFPLFAVPRPARLHGLPPQPAALPVQEHARRSAATATSRPTCGPRTPTTSSRASPGGARTATT